jgi:hypothetical protein
MDSPREPIALEEVNDLLPQKQIAPSKPNNLSSPSLPSLLTLSILLNLHYVLFVAWTVIPVLIDGGAISYWNYAHPEDILRFLDPYVNATSLFAVILPSLPFDFDLGNRRALLKVSYFGLSWSMFLAGCGTHAAAALCKNSVESSLEANIVSNVDWYPALYDVYYFLRESLQHDFGHYLYAVGYEMLTWCVVIGYWTHPEDEEFKYVSKTGGLLLIATVFRTILTTAVGLQFPFGPLVVTVYCFFSLLTLFALKFKEQTLKKLSVVQKLMIPAFVVCLLVLVIRMISQKSIKGQNDK